MPDNNTIRQRAARKKIRVTFADGAGRSNPTPANNVSAGQVLDAREDGSYVQLSLFD